MCKKIVIFASAAILAGCKVGPDHQAPEISLPTSFSSNGVSWKQTSPPKVYENSQWWKVFGDSTLNKISNEVAENNLSLKAAGARLEEARALSSASRTKILPSLDFSPSANRSSVRFVGLGGSSSRTITGNNFSLPLDLSYEVDLWGKVRREIEGSKAQESSANARLIATKLTLTADAAQTYWALRGLDAEQEILASSQNLRREALILIEARFRAGTITALDVSRAKTEVATSESEVIALKRQRSELVNAIAVLTGKAASNYQISPDASLPKVPRISAGIPADLLLRRPDLYAAERNVAVANADIGIAQSAFYPSLRINAASDLSSALSSSLTNSNSIIWSLGSDLTYPLIGQKLIRIRRDSAIARHKVVSEEYKQLVLVALRESEDALKGLYYLSQQEDAASKAAESANTTLVLSKERFKAGLTSFLDVVEVERTLLASKRAVNSIRVQRLALTVNLVKAIGGSW
jgi:outer membrane protein, multidrug efflux system